MSLWVDKYRPDSLEKLDYHTELSKTLQNVTGNDDMPHLLIYGPSGAGKKTRVHAILKELFGNKIEKIKIEQRIFTTPSNRKVEINVTSSNVHLEVNPADVGIYDRVIIQDLIKEIAQTQQVDSSASRKFKVVVIKEADQLSRDAQHGLRRTMEKYMNSMRVILCCSSTSRIIGPIQSRCLLVRVAAPSDDQIKKIVNSVSQKEGLLLPEQFCDRIVEEADGNLRLALLQLEAARVQNYPFTETQVVPIPDWKTFIKETVREIIEEQSPSSLLRVRAKLYELLTHCIPAEVILSQLLFELNKQIDEQLKYEVVSCAAFYEHRIKIGTKPIFHLEAFVAKFMHIYKQYLLQMMN